MAAHETTVVVTGAAGGMGTMMRPLLARDGRVLRLLDLQPIEARPGEEVVQASVTDLDALTAAFQGADAVVHLAGQSTESSWKRVLQVNIDGTYAVFEAARRAGVGRVIFASSNHVMGFREAESFPVAESDPVLPDTYYGVSKAAGEALGALYHHRYGLDVVCIRILSCSPRPTNVRALSTWLSPHDCARLLEACLAAPSPGYRIVYGVSANTRGGWVSLAGARELGFEPQDDAEEFAEDVLRTAGPGSADELRYLGGGFCDPSLDAPRGPSNDEERVHG